MLCLASFQIRWRCSSEMVSTTDRFSLPRERLSGEGVFMLDLLKERTNLTQRQCTVGVCYLDEGCNLRPGGGENKTIATVLFAAK